MYSEAAEESIAAAEVPSASPKEPSEPLKTITPQTLPVDVAAKSKEKAPGATSGTGYILKKFLVPLILIPMINSF